jgi:hypothetical protein
MKVKTLKFYFLLLICLFEANNILQAQTEKVEVSIEEGIYNQELKNTIEKNASLVLSAFNEAVKEGKKPAIPATALTKNAKNKINLLWKISMMQCTDSLISRDCMKTSYDDYQIRNIPVVMTSAVDSMKNEEIALDFAPDGRVNNVMVTVKNHQFLEILKSNISIDDFVMEQKIKEFVDRFRDAYNCRDIKTLELIFSNDALIITGVKIKLKEKSDMALQSLGKEKFIMQVQTKDQYLGKLKNVFKKNQYLNVVFEDVNIRKHPNPLYNKIYGVTLKQKWNSTTYSDVGYIFLLINCVDKYNMEIFVRTWQPEKDTSPDEIFNFSSFKNMVIKS